MSSLVLLRWILRPGLQHGSTRKLIETRVSPAIRAGGWLWGPNTTHYVSDQGGEAWVTVVTPLDDATTVQEELSELLGSPPTHETTRDAVLEPTAEWYRVALQEVTHVGLDVLDARGSIPLSEYEAFESPGNAAPVLTPFLNESSETYRRACHAYEPTERFWLAFFRRGPSSEMSPSGHWLWNLAG